jgi:hypothetical protein
MDWHIWIALDEYKKRVEDSQSEYDFYQVTHADRGGTRVSSKLLALSGRLAITFGKKLQTWGGVPTGMPHTRTRRQE